MLTVALTCAQLTISLAMPADIVARAPGEWAIVPGAVPRCGFDTVEARFTALLQEEPVLLAGGHRLTVVFDTHSGYARAGLPGHSAFDTVTVHGNRAPVQAAYGAREDCREEGPHSAWFGRPVWPDRPDREPQEPFDPSVLSGWLFRHGGLEPAWQVIDARTEAEESFLTVDTQGDGRIATSRWSGLKASRHPVAVVQLRAGSGIGTTTLEWIDDQGSSGSVAAPVNQWGDWVQLAMPLYRHPAWRGRIAALSLRPIDHPSTVALDWIAFPSLGAVWALLLGSGVARWTAVGALTAILAAALRRATLSRAVTLACAVGCASASSVVLFPYPELMPRVWIWQISAPWHLVALAAIAAWGFRGSRWNERAAWGCVVITVAHGALVAEGAGLQTALSLAAVPLAYAAGASLRRAGCALPAMLTLSAIVAALSLHAMLFPDPARDPLYGTLSSTLGRAYGDILREGRAGGAFVHPLVFAMTAATTGTALLAVGGRRNASLAVGLVTVAAGIASLSRVYFALLATGTAWLLRHRRWLLCAACAALLVAAVAGARGSQGLWRSLHIGRRAAGVQVATGTLMAKPVQGVGWGRYERAARRFGPPVVRARPYTTPDNTYARLMAEGGLLGAGAWLGWLVAAGYAAFGRPTSWISPAAPFACLAVMWAVFDGAFWPAAAASSFALGTATNAHTDKPR